MLAEHKRAYQAGEKPSLSFFSMGKEFIQLRKQTDWMQDLHCATIRYSSKRLSDALTQAVNGVRGFPKFKARHGDDYFTIPNKVDIKIKNSKLWIPKCGWMVIRRNGGDPYSDGTPLQVIVKRELGKWFAYVVWEVEISENENESFVGIDMNAGQAATSDHEIMSMPDASKDEAKSNRYQRTMSRRKKGSGRRSRARFLFAKAQRRLRHKRQHWHHCVSRDIANRHGVAVVENLNTKGMTSSAKGTIENPGKNVKQKAGLNRVILKTGWSGLRQKLDYKMKQVVEVNPAYTSQTCYRCGHVDKANRLTQSQFKCVRCEHEDNADINAALNIKASGIEASAQGGAFGLPTPAICEKIYESYPVGTSACQL